MATGGSFKLIVNDGPQDKLMMRSHELSDLIAQLEHNSEDRESYVPSLAEISKYYTVPIYSFFKPFVACSMEYIKNKQPSGAIKFGTSQEFTIDNIGAFVTDMVLHIKISSFSAVHSSDKVRWTAFPGHRIVEHTEMRVSGNPIDEYYNDNYTAHYDLEVDNAHKTTWKRCVGQQVPYEGTLVPDPSVDEINEVRQFVDGPQTFKHTQPELDLWIPTLFWFNKDPAYALPNRIISHGHNTITFSLADVNEMVSYARINGTGSFVQPTITMFELYVNHIFVVDEVSDMFLARSGTSLVRLHKFQKSKIQKSKDRILMKDLRFPVERFHFAFRPSVNLNHSQQWYKMCALTERYMASSVVIEVPDPLGGPTTVLQLAGNYSTFYTESPTIDRVGLDAHNITMFPMAPEGLYKYMELQHGNVDTTSPASTGWYTMNFNINPIRSKEGWRAPSAYINASKARELYLAYESSYIGTTISPVTIPATDPYVAEVDFIACATVIGFITYADNSAVLKFST